MEFEETAEGDEERMKMTETYLKSQEACWDDIGGEDEGH